MPCRPKLAFIGPVVLAVVLSLAMPLRGQTLLYSGGEWDFESGFYWTPHMLAGQCSNPPPGAEPWCVPSYKTVTLGNGWAHYVSFPPPDWTGPPYDWTVSYHYGVASINENQFPPNCSRGVRSQEITMTYAHGVGIVYRKVSVPAGHRIRFEADNKYTPSATGWPDIEGWMGLDPTGNTNPKASSVQWDRWDSYSPLTWHRTREEIDATGLTVTLFIMAVLRLPSPEGGTFMIDNVEVYDLGPSAPAIDRNPAALTPYCISGLDAENDTFTIRNDGGGTLNYTIADDVGWLAVTPANGHSTGETDTITVTYNTGALEIGQHAATITVTAPGASNTPQTIAVQLTVRAKPADLDGDGDVDQVDFGLFQVCFTGPGVSPPPPGCEAGDFDADADVDSQDFQTFAGCISGPDNPSAPDCD